MNVSYKALVNYVKNLFPGIAPVAPSDNPQLDAMVINQLSSSKFYTVASNQHRYWYCFVDESNINLARYILRANGVDAQRHNSKYYGHGCVKEPVLRVRTAYLDQNPDAKKFVGSVMELGIPTEEGASVVQARIEQIRQKMK